MRIIIILTVFLQLGSSLSAQCPYFFESDSSDNYYVSIDPKHRNFNVVKHFGTSTFSPTAFDSSKFSSFLQIDENDSLLSAMTEYSEEIRTLSRSNAGSIPGSKWQLLSITVNYSGCPALRPWTHSREVYHFDAENNLFSKSNLKRSFDEKSGWDILTLGDKYVRISRGNEYIGNDSWRWGVTYVFRAKEN